jgi:hypothetical protein
MKVSELTGVQLDYWVGQAEGKESYIYSGYCFLPPPHRKPGDADGNFQPSTDWKQAGPIIERESIDLMHIRCIEKENDKEAFWDAAMWSKDACKTCPESGQPTHDRFNQYGDTPLIAAMRAYVASKYGEEVPA